MPRASRRAPASAERRRRTTRRVLARSRHRARDRHHGGTTRPGSRGRPAVEQPPHVPLGDGGGLAVDGVAQHLDEVGVVVVRVRAAWSPYGRPPPGRGRRTAASPRRPRLDWPGRPTGRGGGCSPSPGAPRPVRTGPGGRTTSVIAIRAGAQQPPARAHTTRCHAGTRADAAGTEDPAGTEHPARADPVAGPALAQSSYPRRILPARIRSPGPRSRSRRTYGTLPARRTPPARIRRGGWWR